MTNNIATYRYFSDPSPSDHQQPHLTYEPPTKIAKDHIAALLTILSKLNLPNYPHHVMFWFILSMYQDNNFNPQPNP